MVATDATIEPVKSANGVLLNRKQKKMIINSKTRDFSLTRADVDDDHSDYTLFVNGREKVEIFYDGQWNADSEDGYISVIKPTWAEVIKEVVSKTFHSTRYDLTGAKPTAVSQSLQEGLEKARETVLSGLDTSILGSIVNNTTVQIGPKAGEVRVVIQETSDWNFETKFDLDIQRYDGNVWVSEYDNQETDNLEDARKKAKKMLKKARKLVYEIVQ